MTSSVKNASSNIICSRDHKSREKASIEKYQQKLIRSAIPRISATQKCIYIFGEIGCNIMDTKKKQNNYVDGFQRSSRSQFNSQKTKTKFFKRQESYMFPTDSHLSDIEKQLKNIQSQKKAINQLIFKDLKTIKYNWQEVRNKANMKNISYNNISHAKKLCETLEKTTQDVESLYRSFTYSDKLKNNQFDSINQNSAKDNNFELAYGRGDNIELTNWNNCVDTSQDFSSNVESNELKNKKKIKELNRNVTAQNDLITYSSKFETNCNDQLEKIYCNPESTIEMLVNLNSFPSTQERILMNNNEQLLDGVHNEIDYTRQLNNKEHMSRFYTSENSSIKENCDASSQVSTTVPVNVINKYPIFNSMLPKVFNSKFLRKSCGFD